MGPSTLQPLAAMATNPAGGREVIGHATRRHKPSGTRVDGEAWSIQTIPKPWETTSAAYRRHVAWRHRLELMGARGEQPNAGRHTLPPKRPRDARRYRPRRRRRGQPCARHAAQGDGLRRRGRRVVELGVIALAITMWAIPPIRASRLGQVLRTESLRRRTDGAQPRCRQFS